MTDSGLVLDQAGLQAAEERYLLKARLASSLALERHGLLLEGPGSGKSKEEYVDRLINEIDNWAKYSDDDASYVSVRNHPLLRKTPKKKQVAFDEGNRNLLKQMLPDEHPAQEALWLAGIHVTCQKMVSSFTYPLLHHQRRHPDKRGSVLVPLREGLGLSHMQWFVVPSLHEGGTEGGTLQGRITCKNFRHQTDPPWLQGLYISRFPGGYLVHIDLSQIELRVAALLSGDPFLMKAYLEDLDLHAQRGKDIFGHEPDYEERQVGKTINFLDLFRGGWKKAQSTILANAGVLMPEDFCKGIIEARPVHRPGLVAWQNNLLDEAERTWKLELPFYGQSRHFAGFRQDTDPDDEAKYMGNEVVNFPVQTTAGNVTLAIQHTVHRMINDMSVRSGVHMVLNVYDALTFDVHPEFLKEFMRDLTIALHEVETVGYWAQLCQLYGRRLPLRYNIDVTPEPH